MRSASVTVSLFLALTICRELAPQNRLLAQQPQSSAPRAETTREERERQMRVLRGLRGAGLHDAAVANGGAIVVEVSPHADFVRAGKLESLGELSEVVVAGTVGRVDTKLSPNGLSIVTYNTIDVGETIKGTSPGQIVVAVTGGKVRFNDGSTAEITTSGYALRVGGRYVLFLARRSDDQVDPEYRDGGVYRVSLGPQGTFDISSTTDGVQSMARPDDPIRKAYSGQRIDAFMSEVRVKALLPPSRR